VPSDRLDLPFVAPLALAPEPDAASGAPRSLSLLCYAPGAATAQFVQGPGGSWLSVGAHPDADGLARLTVPAALVQMNGPAQLVLRDRSGRETQRVRAFVGGDSDRWGDQLDGPVTGAS
jgi:hypothetical protein